MEPNDYADDISTVSEGSEDEDEMDANAIADRLLKSKPLVRLL